jgi:glycerophosphoryl diester phosphodiesterase
VSSKSPDLPREFLRAPIAHRGLHDRAKGRIENSRASVRAAVEAGYGIEIDIQRAGCGEAMVFHDASLRRITGRRCNVADFTAAELGGIELSGGGETIPTLGEILAIVAGRSALLIEGKDPDASLTDTGGALEARVGELLAGYGGPVALMSFNPHSVAAFGRAAPERARGLTTCDFVSIKWACLPDYRRAELAGLGDFASTGSSFISHNRKELDNPAVSRLRSQDMPVLCWVTRSEVEEKLARKMADNITFDGYSPALPG